MDTGAQRSEPGRKVSSQPSFWRMAMEVLLKGYPAIMGLGESGKTDIFEKYDDYWPMHFLRKTFVKVLAFYA
jgi:hypothetical protein